MLFSESMCFFKKTKPIPQPILDSEGHVTGPWQRSYSVADLKTPVRPRRAYSNKPASPTKSPRAPSPSWMRKMSLGTYSRSGSVDSNASSSSKLDFSGFRRKKSVAPVEPQMPQERRPSLWTHHMDGEPRTIFKNAGRDERGRLKLEYQELDEVEW